MGKDAFTRLKICSHFLKKNLKLEVKEDEVYKQPKTN